MYTVISSFEYSSNLELAIGEIQHLGIANKNIYAVPLDQRAEAVHLFDTIHKADGKSLLDLAAILGCIGMLLGVIYGFRMTMGPILAGLAGLVLGAAVGFAIDYATTARRQARNKSIREAQVLLFVVCPEHLLEKIEGILWGQFAQGIAKIKRDRDPSQQT